MCCDPSSEPSHRDGSDEGSQHMVSMRNKKKLSSVMCISANRVGSLLFTFKHAFV